MPTHIMQSNKGRWSCKTAPSTVLWHVSAHNRVSHNGQYVLLLCDSMLKYVEARGTHCTVESFITCDNWQQ